MSFLLVEGIHWGVNMLSVGCVCMLAWIVRVRSLGLDGCTYYQYVFLCMTYWQRTREQKHRNKNN